MNSKQPLNSRYVYGDDERKIEPIGWNMKQEFVIRRLWTMWDCKKREKCMMEELLKYE